jgi:hypothetical protein
VDIRVRHHRVTLPSLSSYNKNLTVAAHNPTHLDADRTHQDIGGDHPHTNANATDHTIVNGHMNGIDATEDVIMAPAVMKATLRVHCLVEDDPDLATCQGPRQGITLQQHHIHQWDHPLLVSTILVVHLLTLR